MIDFDLRCDIRFTIVGHSLSAIHRDVASLSIRLATFAAIIRHVESFNVERIFMEKPDTFNLEHDISFPPRNPPPNGFPGFTPR